MSLTMVWLRLLNVTVAAVTTPAMPETVTVDGYEPAIPIWFGEPVAGIARAVELAKLVGPSAAALVAPTTNPPPINDRSSPRVPVRRSPILRGLRVCLLDVAMADLRCARADHGAYERWVPDS